MRPLRRLRRRLGAAIWPTLTVLGLARRGFFIRYDYAAGLPETVPVYDAVERLFRRDDAAFEAFIDEMATHLDTFRTFDGTGSSPRWGGAMLPPLDGAAAYAMVRRAAPRRIVEIGSGDSTRFLVRAARDAGARCAIVCIDPQPRRAIEDLGVDFRRRMLGEEDVALCETLEPGDILFIDSSHIMMQGMDVDIEFNRIFPVLRPGVLVHVHDVFLPFGYPEHWSSRFFNEQNALIGWLISGYFRVVFPGHYATRRLQPLLEAALGAFEPLRRPLAGSLWLRRA